jgi:hypothetical protein
LKKTVMRDNSFETMMKNRKLITKTESFRTNASTAARKADDHNQQQALHEGEDVQIFDDPQRIRNILASFPQLDDDNIIIPVNNNKQQVTANALFGCRDFASLERNVDFKNRNKVLTVPCFQ